MDKIPHIPSKTETYAKVQCQREEHKLSSIKDELDKIWQSESRVLKTHRNRFIIDRRRSLRNVYNSQIEGIQPHLRLRRRRRESAPEIIDIFRQQEDRRQSIRVMERALSQDVVRRLERKYHDALDRNRSEVDEEYDALLAPNIDIEGPDYEEREKDHGKTGKEREEDGEKKYHGKTTKQEREQEEKGHTTMMKEARNEQGEADHETTTKKEEEHKETDDGKIQKKETEQRKKDQKTTTRKEKEEEKDRRETTKTEREEERKDHAKMKTETEHERKSDKKPMKKESEKEDKDHTKTTKPDTGTGKRDHEKTKKLETEPWTKNHEKPTKKPETEPAKKENEKPKKPESEQDEKKHERMTTKESKEENHSKPKRTHKTKPTDPSPQRSKTSKSDNTHTTPNQPSPKQTRPSKKAARYEDRNENGHKHSTEDSSTRNGNPHHSNPAKDKPSSPVETRKIPKRKRSYSDGNIFMNILELEDTIRQTYELSRAAAEVASEAAAVALRRSDQDDSEDDARMPYPRGSWGRTGADECSASQSYSSESSEHDTSDVELDIPESSPRMRRRRVGEVSLEFPSPDVVLLPRRHADVKWQTHERDVSHRVKTARRGSYPHTEEIRLSPSLQRRLANVGLASPRNKPDTRDDVKYSPSVTRRRPDVSCSPAMTRRQADVTYYSPQSPRRGVWAASDRDSPPTRWRKDDKPKRIFQQGEAEKQVLKRRPLRRSRSEAFDVSAFVTARERQVVEEDRMGRRGSDSLQGLSTAGMGHPVPRAWNSLLYGLTLSPEEKEAIARRKREELVTSLRKRQEEVDSDVSRRIQTFLQRYDDA